MVQLQISDVDINKAWEISPYNASAFGALIVVLFGIIYYFTKQLDKKDEIIKEKDALIQAKDKVIYEIHDQANEMTNVLSEKLTEIKHSNHMSTKDLMNILENILNKLNKI